MLNFYYRKSTQQLFFGPCESDNNFHYVEYDGTLDPKGDYVGVWATSDQPNGSTLISDYEAALILDALNHYNYPLSYIPMNPISLNVENIKERHAKSLS